MTDKSPLTAETARRLLDYSPSKGTITWLVSPSPGVKAGDIAGALNDRGYRRIKIYGKYYRAHRLAYLLKDGEWPTGQVDHINGIRSDNRWDNLRLATPAQNQWNKGKQKNNTSGFPGVHLHKASGKYMARIRFKGRRLHLGLFPTAREAAQVREEFAKRQRGSFYRPPIAA